MAEGRDRTSQAFLGRPQAATPLAGRGGNDGEWALPGEGNLGRAPAPSTAKGSPVSQKAQQVGAA